MNVISFVPACRTSACAVLRKLSAYLPMQRPGCLEPSSPASPKDIPHVLFSSRSVIEPKEKAGHTPNSPPVTTVTWNCRMPLCRCFYRLLRSPDDSDRISEQGKLGNNGAPGL